jgi:hypothetical protein
MGWFETGPSVSVRAAHIIGLITEDQPVEDFYREIL